MGSSELLPRAKPTNRKQIQSRSRKFCTWLNFQYRSDITWCVTRPVCRLMRYASAITGQNKCWELLAQKFRLQNSPYFCVFKYARAVKQKVWNEAEDRERDCEAHARDASLYRFLYWFWEKKKKRLFCSLSKVWPVLNFAQQHAATCNRVCKRTQIYFKFKLIMLYYPYTYSKNTETEV